MIQRKSNKSSKAVLRVWLRCQSSCFYVLVFLWQATGEDAAAAAEGVCMAVHGYLRTVGQLHRYKRDDVLEHLDACIAQETTTKVFVNRYLAQVGLPTFLFPSAEHWRSRMAKKAECLGGWLFFSPNDISGLRRPKKVKFGTKVASSMRMVCALRLLGKVF